MSGSKARRGSSRSRSASRRPKRLAVNNADAICSDKYLPPWKSVSFACGGWLQFYMYGVGRALQARGIDSPDEVVYCGCSAGALAAAGLAYEGNFDAAVEYCKDECIPSAHNGVGGLFQLDEYVGECIERELIPIFKALRPGQLQIAITKLPFFQAERVIEHATPKDLKTTLLASAAAYPAAPMVKRHGLYYMDGGLSDFQPIVDENTLTISPFYFSNCDIRPSRYVPLWWAFIPPKNADTVDWLYALGYNDAMEYFDKVGIPTRNSLSPKKESLLSKSIKTKYHPYDTPRQLSVYRFLGYDMADVYKNNHILSFLMDFSLAILFVAVWKPLALLLIYLELLLLMIHSLSRVVLFEVWNHSWTMIPILGVGLAVTMKQYTISLLLLLFFIKMLLNTASKRTTQYQLLMQIKDAFICIWSLSLLLRFVSQRPSSTQLRKHETLYSVSIFYRLFRHII